MATVTKRGDSYKITVSCGYDMSGKQIRKHITWTPESNMTAKQIEKELERQKFLFEEKCRTGQVLDGSIRFADFAEKWFSEYADKHLRPRTLAGYKHLMTRINAAIGNIRLDKLQPHHLNAFYDNLAEAGIRDDIKYKCLIDFKEQLSKRSLTKVKLAEMAGVSISVLNSITQGRNISEESAAAISNTLNITIEGMFEPVNDTAALSSKTILHHHRLISSILQTAVQWQVIFSNPCDRVKPPKVESKEPKFLDEVEATRLLELIEKEDTQYKVMIKLLLYTGFRRGELCGLEWSDIDFKNSIIHVRRSSLYLPEKGVFEDITKNATSQRSIKAPQIAMAMLKDYRTWQAERRFLMGDRWTNSDRLFTALDGNPIHPDTLSGWFHDFIRKNDLPQISIHSLRHTNATLQIAAGVPLSTVAKRLGHANATTTTKIYVHAIRSADEAAADTIENILAPRPLNISKSL